MPAPLAIPVLGKALAALKGAVPFAKGMVGLGTVGAKPTAATLGAFAKGAKAKRFAGEALNALAGKAKAGIDASKMSLEQLRNLKTKDVLNAGFNMSDDAGLLDRVRRSGTLEGFKKNLGMPMTKDDILMAVAPDLLFGGITAATTEGDLGDKLIAGTGSAVGGIAGGIGARGVLGPKSGMGILGTELVGGMVGDQVGYGAAEGLIRAKNGGQTPLEQKIAEGDEAYRQQLLAELQAQYGLR